MLGHDAIVEKVKDDRTPGNGTAHAPCEMQRRAALERRVDGSLINIAHFPGTSWLA